MEIALAVLVFWLLGNAVALLAWARHRGVLTGTPVGQPSVTVPVQRGAVDAPAQQPAPTV